MKNHVFENHTPLGLARAQNLKQGSRLQREVGTSSCEVYLESSEGFEARETGIEVASFTFQTNALEPVRRKM